VLDPLPAAAGSGFEADFEVTGRAGPGAALELIVDGDPARAQRLLADAAGRFRATVDTRRMSDAALRHRLVVRDVDSGLVSDAAGFRVALPWRPLADVLQAARVSAYSYPTHESYTRQMDLQRTRVSAAGGALRIELQMADLTRVWGPANGFDHVAFSIFVELPGRGDGVRAMPGQNAELPEGMRWHLRLRAHGWSNALFGPEGADTTRDGRSITPAARIESDPLRRTVIFTIPAEAIGDVPGFSGARVLVTTWDWDGGWRPLAPQPAAFVIGGGAADGPRIFDASPVIRLP
jgi:hypothetical protein